MVEVVASLGAENLLDELSPLGPGGFRGNEMSVFCDGEVAFVDDEGNVGEEKAQCACSEMGMVAFGLEKLRAHGVGDVERPAQVAEEMSGPETGIEDVAREGLEEEAA